MHDAHSDCFFFFNDTATTEIYPLSLHDALPISLREVDPPPDPGGVHEAPHAAAQLDLLVDRVAGRAGELVDDDPLDRKSTRLNSSHANISYAVFCLKKKKQT